MAKIISVKEAAQQKCCSENTIYRWIHENKVDAIKDGGKWKILCNKKWTLCQKGRKSDLQWKEKYENLLDAYQTQTSALAKLFADTELKRRDEESKKVEAENKKQEAENKILELKRQIQETEKQHQVVIKDMLETNQALAEAQSHNCKEIRRLQMFLYAQQNFKPGFA